MSAVIRPKLSAVSAKQYLPKAGTYVQPALNGVRDYYIDLPVEDLLVHFPRNTHQRDEEVRVLDHLKQLCPEHRTVQLLQGLDGRIVLIDAHSRKFLWLLNAALRPERIHVHVFDIVDASVSFEDEELRLYENCDSRRAVKTSAHTVQGAMNARGIELTTNWLKKGGFAEGIKTAARFVKGAPSFKTKGIGELVGYFKEELKILDSISPSSTRFVVPFLASAIILLRADRSAKTIEMLRRYNSRSERLSSNDHRNGFSLLEHLRDVGLHGYGLVGAGKGRFPTNTADVDKAVCQIVPYMVVSRANYAEMFAPRAAAVRPMLRGQIQKLTLKP